MSLFQSREFWGVQCGYNEEFDQGCMCVANVDNCPTEADKIITGSFQGFLRIYLPATRTYQAEHLLLEKKLDSPIIQIECGYFLNNLPDTFGLAVLHPRALVIYQIEAVTDNQSTSGNYYNLTQRVCYSLKHTAFNMTYGPFGGVYGKDFICVQSLDGILFFFEHSESSRCLSEKYIVPGPIRYIAELDAFIIANSANEVECFKYQHLAIHSRDDEDATDASTCNRFPVPIWSTCVGQGILDIFPARFSSSRQVSELDIIVLCECGFFCFSENGEIRLQKRFEFHPAAAYCFPIQPEEEFSSQHLIISTHTGNILVYNGQQLLWAMNTQNPSDLLVSLHVSQFADTPGLITALSDSGHLMALYLGTSPTSTIVAPIKNEAELDYGAIEHEMQQLSRHIRECSQSHTSRSEPKPLVEISVSFKDKPSPALRRGGKKDTDLTTIQANVNFQFVNTSVGAFLNDLQVSLSPPYPFKAQPNHFVVHPDAAYGAFSQQVTFRAVPTRTLSSLTGTCSAAYEDNGEPRTAYTSFRIPFEQAGTSLRLASSATSTEATRYKIILETVNQGVLSPASLFENVSDGSSPGDNLLAILPGDSLVLIAPSKTSGRYRLSSNSFHGLGIITEEFYLRLCRHLGEIKILFEGKLPFDDFFSLVDTHLHRREKFKQATSFLDQHAIFFRVIQKRLLVRFKDRNAVPLQSMDSLFDESFDTLISLADKSSKQKKLLSEASAQLSAATILIQYLVKFLYNLNMNEFSVLQQYLSSIPTTDTFNHFWEEITDGSLVHLLRSTLSKDSENVVFAPTSLSIEARDSQKLKHDFITVCERLEKGLKLYSPPKKTPKKKEAK